MAPLPGNRRGADCGFPGVLARRVGFVMAGLDPAIHDLNEEKTWMPGTRPGMTHHPNLS
jgi:hypothetical protein